MRLAGGTIVAVINGPTTKVDGLVKLFRDIDEEDTLAIILCGSVFQLDWKMQIVPGNTTQAIDDICGLLTGGREEGRVVIDAEGRPLFQSSSFNSTFTGWRLLCRFIMASSFQLIVILKLAKDKDNEFIGIRQMRFDSSSCSAPASVRAFFNLRHCRTFEL